MLRLLKLLTQIANFSVTNWRSHIVKTAKKESLITVTVHDQTPPSPFKPLNLPIDRYTISSIILWITAAALPLLHHEFVDGNRVPTKGLPAMCLLSSPFRVRLARCSSMSSQRWRGFITTTPCRPRPLRLLFCGTPCTFISLLFDEYHGARTNLCASCILNKYYECFSYPISFYVPTSYCRPVTMVLTKVICQQLFFKKKNEKEKGLK